MRFNKDSSANVPSHMNKSDLYGTLVAVVGPSGSRKDTLMRKARLSLSHDSNIPFPQRMMTCDSEISVKIERWFERAHRAIPESAQLDRWNPQFANFAVNVQLATRYSLQIFHGYGGQFFAQYETWLSNVHNGK